MVTDLLVTGIQIYIENYLFPKIKEISNYSEESFKSPAHCLPSRPSTISNSTS